MLKYIAGFNGSGTALELFAKGLKPSNPGLLSNPEQNLFTLFKRPPGGWTEGPWELAYCAAGNLVETDGAVSVHDNQPGERSRPSNPKTLAATTRVPMCLTPDTALVHLSLSFLEGYLKYGLFNWRAVGVSVMEYISAIKRHLGKFENGQDADPETLVHELASVMACCAIILDAKAVGKLNDDRPLPAPMFDMLREAEKVVKHLQELHKDKKPRHWKIGDADEASKL